MNHSKVVFPNRYHHIMVQDSGECDFVDEITGEKFDAKLLFNEELGQLAAGNKRDYVKWIKAMSEMEGEFGEFIMSRGEINVEDLSLYQILEQRISKDKDDENIIFFFPYPIILDCGPDSMTHFAGNLLNAVYGKLRENGIVKERKIYVIYPCAIEKLIAIYCLNNNKKEYLSNELIEGYIDYKMALDSNYDNE